MIGKTISHYKIIEKLGQGGMGMVYKAEDLTLGRTVALKFVSSNIDADDTLAKRLKREAKACASINHPNITTIYEFVQIEGLNFIVMEYVEGSTLHELLRENTLEIGQVLEIILQALDALSIAHKKGFIHRDLKPSNIMLDTYNRVKIMDFGLVKPIDDFFLTQDTMTQTGMTLGTVVYMSPEQVKGEELDQRSDIYSMAVVLYHLLTGSLPFKSIQQYAMTHSIVNDIPTPPSKLNPAIPLELEEIILKAMAKRPQKRYQDVIEMRTSLLNVQHAFIGDSKTNGAASEKNIQPSQTPLAETMLSIRTIATSPLQFFNKKNLTLPYQVVKKQLLLTKMIDLHII